MINLNCMLGIPTVKWSYSKLEKKMKYRKTILIDLDGVLNTYTGNYDENFIPPIKEGAYEFLKDISNNYDIKIFTTRNLLQTSEWVIKNNIKNFIKDVTNIKEPAYLQIDDRCINFNGDFYDLKNSIPNFKTWYK